ncbi:hypothetical protein [Streptomyces sp. NPDC005423]|uniref:hypothetical protein n=1 Tax=Streptomyces sp. NPDC005423 TaxID=3155343 RepID=UPI0033A27709
MAHTFGELVEKQRAADQAQTRVREMREALGAPAHEAWTDTQTDTYETAWRAWRDLARDLQATAEEYAKEQGLTRTDVEAEVRRVADGDPGPEGG